MTGETSHVDRDEHPFHFAVADEFRAEVHPFDKYLGPYVLYGDQKFFLADDEGLVYWVNQATKRFGGVFNPEATDATVNAIATFRDLVQSGGSDTAPILVVDTLPANVTFLLTELGESLRIAYRGLADAEGVELANDDDAATIEFNRRHQRMRQALYLFDQWHDREGIFRDGADPREGTPVEADSELIWRRADQVKVGDYLDLTGDKYCDPNSERAAFEFELAQVAQVDVPETPACTVIYIEGVAGFGMPPDHLLKVKPGDETESTC